MKRKSSANSGPIFKDRLLVQLKPHVDNAMLQEIAAADYGNDRDKHFAQLGTIHTTTKIPSPLPWEPKEVLELVRWSEPEDPAWRPGGQGARGHVMRAWCCALLLRAGCDPESQPYFLGHADTAVNLIRSLAQLPFDASAAAFDLLLALLESEHDDPPLSAEHVLIETGLIRLFCAFEVLPKAKTAAALDRIAEGISDAQTPWHFANVCLKHDSWRDVAIQLRDQKRADLCDGLLERVKTHAEKLLVDLVRVPEKRKYE